MKMIFICHPYHRGGVTSWMKNAYIDCLKREVPAIFLTLKPSKSFISSGNRPEMLSFLGVSQQVFYKTVDYSYELGTLDYKASQFQKLIEKYASPGDLLIPSDDEACWRASAMLANSYKIIGVIHSIEKTYQDMLSAYQFYLAGVVTVSNRIKNLVIKNGFKNLPCQIIPCGIPIQPLVDHIKTNEIVWVGRLEEVSKRVSDIPKIALLLKEESINWKLHVFGDGEPMENLKQWVHQEEMENQVILHGWKSSEEILNALNQSKLLLQTSNYEGMSIAVMEALSMGCQVVSTQVSGVEDLVNDVNAQEVVRLYPIGDVDKAKEQIIEVLEKEDSSINQKAFQLAKRHYSIEACIDQYLNFSRGLEVSSEAYPKITLMRQFYSKSIALARYFKYKIRFN